MLLERIADHLQVTVIIEEPHVGQLGEYQASKHLIRLHPRLSGLLLTSVLAHELGHAAYRHTTSTTVTEREADHFAHWVLIPFCRYVQATHAHTTPQGVAHDLGVLPSTIREYTRRVHDEYGP
jgi:hypothetical protein